MAERVNQRVEETISELEQMQRIDLYTSDEIREIARKRKEFEYKIHRQQKGKEDYIRYIAYESALLKDICLRRKQIQTYEKQQDIEYAITKRLIQLYKQLIFRFQADINVWLEYIKFCKNVDFNASVSQIIGAMLQIHGDKPKAWHLASMWESQETGNLDLTMKFLLKGLHRHPTSVLLYKEAILTEILQGKIESDENKDIRLKRAEVICNNAMMNIHEVEFRIEICNVIKPHKIATPIFTNLFTKIWADHRDELELWNFIALCELDGIHFNEVNDLILNEDTPGVEIPDNIRNAISIYEYALSKFENDDSMTMYLKMLIGLSIDQCSTQLKIHLLKSALQQGHESSLLTEDWYKFWIQLLLDDSPPIENIDQILEDACLKSPSFQYLWEIRVNRKKNNAHEVKDILLEAKKYLKPEKTIFLWKLILEDTKNVTSLKTFHREAQLLPICISVPLRIEFLKRFYEICGIKSVRKEYLKMVNVPPLTLSIHSKMLEIEAEQDTVDLKSCRRCHEYATQQFGKDNPQVWLDYIEFEIKNGNPHATGHLHSRAVAHLKHEQVDKFINLYALQKAGSVS